MAPVAAALADGLSKLKARYIDSPAFRDAVHSIYARSADTLWGESSDSSVYANVNSLQERDGYAKPNDFSKGIIGIFAILGGAMAFLVWWFFQMKGGFVWREEDWDDYKSSVLRRKGPDGKTISSGSTRAPETVVTEMTYQSEYLDEDAMTEKESQAEHQTPKAKWFKKNKRSNSKKSTKSGMGAFGRWRKRDRSPTSTDRDADLESYADEEPARMTSYNPYPVRPPSVISESDIASQAASHNNVSREKSTKHQGVGRYPSRYAYAYSGTDTASEKSTPMGPRQSTKKGPSSKRSESNASHRSKRQPSKRAVVQPDLSTIADETETRLSFEMEDDAAFTVFSEPIAAPKPALTSPPKPKAPVGAATPAAARGTKSYPYPPQASAKAAGKPTTGNGKSRKNSGRTYQTASTDSESECPSDCSCCTTDSDGSDSEDDVSNVSSRFRESARGDLGTKVYHHPLPLNVGRISSPVPSDRINVGKRGQQTASGSATPVGAIKGKRSYRNESRGSLSSDSEGESGGETVVSKVKKALHYA